MDARKTELVMSELVMSEVVMSELVMSELVMSVTHADNRLEIVN